MSLTANENISSYDGHSCQTLSRTKCQPNKLRNAEQDESLPEVVWVSKTYDPLDLRSTAPVARKKFVETPDFKADGQLFHEPSVILPKWGKKWAQNILPSMQSTRCEDWSTLRCMLPSQGHPESMHPPNWGTGMSSAPPLFQTKATRFPKINSPMTRYVDDMHRTNCLFRLY